MVTDQTILVGLYGSIRIHPWVNPDPSEYDVYGAFHTRATAMLWDLSDHQGMWVMNDAGQDWGANGERLAWVQVGLTRPEDVVAPVVPVVSTLWRCLVDAGIPDVTAVECLIPMQRVAAPGRYLASARSIVGPTDPTITTSVTIELAADDPTLATAATQRAIAAAADTIGGDLGVRLVEGPGTTPAAPRLAENVRISPNPALAHFAATIAQWSPEAVAVLVMTMTGAAMASGVTATLACTVRRT